MDPALKSMIKNMPEKTGKSLNEWMTELSSEQFDKHSMAVNFLKKEHNVTHGFANTIDTLWRDKDNQEIDLVASQYEGKSALMPIYKKLITLISAMGDDITVTPKKGSVSVIRAKQFALIKPASKKRIDLGLKLKDIAPQNRLENSGPFGTMCTHRIQLSELADVDDEVVRWLALAYDMSI